MSEAVAAWHIARHQQRCTQQVIERGQRRAFLEPGGRDRDVKRHRVTDDGRRAGKALRVVRQRAYLLVDRQGDPFGYISRRNPRLSSPSSRELLKVERVAPGLDEQRRPRGAGRSSSSRRSASACVRASSDNHTSPASRAAPRERVDERGTRRGGPEGQDEHHSAARRPT